MLFGSPETPAQRLVFVLPSLEISQSWSSFPGGICWKHVKAYYPQPLGARDGEWGKLQVDQKSLGRKRLRRKMYGKITALESCHIYWGIQCATHMLRARHTVKTLEEYYWQVFGLCTGRRWRLRPNYRWPGEVLKECPSSEPIGRVGEYFFLCFWLCQVASWPLR